MDGGNYMNKEKMIEKYFKDCILRKRLNEKTIKAYRIDLDQFSKYIDDITVGKAVRASSSFPAVFCPCKYKKFRFLDGGVLDNIPVAEVKKQGADKVIAVNFKADDITEESNIMDIVMRTIDIMGNKISEEGLSSSDYVLTVETDKTGLLDFEKLDKCYKYGYQAAIKEMDKIKEIVTKR